MQKPKFGEVGRPLGEGTSSNTLLNKLSSSQIQTKHEKDKDLGSKWGKQNIVSSFKNPKTMSSLTSRNTNSNQSQKRGYMIK